MAKSKLKIAEREEVRSMNDETLSDKIEENVIRLKKLKFSHAVNPIENPAAIKELRRSIARMKTEQRKRDSIS